MSIGILLLSHFFFLILTLVRNESHGSGTTFWLKRGVQTTECMRGDTEPKRFKTAAVVCISGYRHQLDEGEE